MNLIEDTVKTMNILAREHMRTGQLQMQSVVLGWLNRHRLALSPFLVHELVDAMDAALIKLSARPHEFKEEDARSRGEVT